MSIFKGSGVALVTPFRKTRRGNIKVDYDNLERLVDYHITIQIVLLSVEQQENHQHYQIKNI